MAKNLTYKLLAAHLVEGELLPGNEIGIRIDHALLQDATGTMAMLEYESLGLGRVAVELAAQYEVPLLPRTAGSRPGSTTGLESCRGSQPSKTRLVAESCANDRVRQARMT